MGAEVRAKSIEHPRFATLRSIGDQMRAEVLERHDLAGQELVGVGDLEPAVRDRGRIEPVLHAPNWTTLFGARRAQNRTCSTLAELGRFVTIERASDGRAQGALQSGSGSSGSVALRNR